ncbi:DUF3768 domain-containing protein [Tritonibacter sp. SIMBA_163]|uniref:DUF3768 domain-containing protein n=1 Tax=Tritonibacter sp. SIMBA_163 TaxID=3080868 RepID=UPI00398061F1
MAEIQNIENTEAAIEAARNALIAEQNDLFRTSWAMDPSVPGQIVMTQGAAALSPEALNAIGVSVIAFDEFTEENDPYGTRDFGVIKVLNDGEEVPLYWKIDLYDTSYGYGSDDCADPTKTRRVLTLLLPSEY